ncbi:hypothetical protein ZIOFF_070109 [Zingiber officinale]|uniref:RRM domain-containing protein n=1 Tax=Zingiber officinale TaxID=94328 RepID=A0A8J5C538_ZINOF|nr:hypothetical protein ZIOFF_070109 [Zingiber officinale]
MASSSSSASSPQQYRSRFGDTTWTKVFVGGLAWETPTEELRRHFEPFGDILEAVIISDKATGRSKGYGFVLSLSLSLFPPPPEDPARREHATGRGADPWQSASSRGPTSYLPDSLRVSLSSVAHWPRGVGATARRTIFQSNPTRPDPRSTILLSSAKSKLAASLRYMASYPSEYGYQQAAMYTSQMAAAPYYYPQLYGPTSPTNVGSSPYQPHYPNLGLGFPMQSQRAAAFPPLQAPPGPRPPLMQHPAPHMEGLPMPSSSHNYFFQLHAPQHAMPPLNSTLDSQAQHEPSSTSGADTDNQDV